MRRMLVVSLVWSAVVLNAQEPNAFKLAAPAGWGGETIRLPPGFAPDMKLHGEEHIRFAPGMMNPDSESFFSYAFVFELGPRPVLTDDVIRVEFLKYYRGLCKAVSNGQRPDVDTSTFKLFLQRVPVDAPPRPDGAEGTVVEYSGTLDWVEPFVTRKPQKLNLEIRCWSLDDRSFVFACVSPQVRDAAVWKQLRAIRDGYLKR